MVTKTSNRPVRLAAALALFRFKVGVIPVVLGAGLLGGAWRLLG